MLRYKLANIIYGKNIRLLYRTGVSTIYTWRKTINNPRPINKTAYTAIVYYIQYSDSVFLHHVSYLIAIPLSPKNQVQTDYLQLQLLPPKKKKKNPKQYISSLYHIFSILLRDITLLFFSRYQTLPRCARINKENKKKKFDHP